MKMSGDTFYMKKLLKSQRGYFYKTTYWEKAGTGKRHLKRILGGWHSFLSSPIVGYQGIHFRILFKSCKCLFCAVLWKYVSVFKKYLLMWNNYNYVLLV